jgi:CBS domain-containing protein
MANVVGEIMAHNPVTLPSDTTVVDAARRMRQDDIGDVIVSDAGNVLGIVTDRDLVVRVLAEGSDPEKTLLAEICSEELVTVEPDTSVEHAARLMREHAVRRLPVMDGDKLVGVISIGDLAIEKDARSALADISAAKPNQ